MAQPLFPYRVLDEREVGDGFTFGSKWSSIGNPAYDLNIFSFKYLKNRKTWRCAVRSVSAPLQLVYMLKSYYRIIEWAQPSLMTPGAPSPQGFGFDEPLAARLEVGGASVLDQI